MNLKTVTCERTGNEIFPLDGFLVATPSTNEWLFMCVVAPEQHSDYCISVASITKSHQAFIGWMAHLQSKVWFSSEKFTTFYTQFCQQCSFPDHLTKLPSPIDKKN